MTDRPLTGLVVADLTRVLAGPYATMLLADLGAEVVKVERPGTGDDTRSWGPPWAADGTSTYFHSVNRGKTSIHWDLQTVEGLDEVNALVARSDVLIENFKPGTMERLGLGWAELHARHPHLVYCSITGFGPDSDLPGYDLLVQAMGGLMSITGAPGHPTKVGVALVDVVTGLHAAYGVLAAVYGRTTTGLGSRVQVNLLSSLLSALVNQSGAFVMTETVPTALGNDHPSIAPYSLYETADGPIVIAVGNDGQFRALVEALRAPHLAVDPRFATNPDRVANREALRVVLESALAPHTRAEWNASLSAVGVPCGPVNDIGEAVRLAESLGLSPILPGHVPTVTNPVRFV